MRKLPQSSLFIAAILAWTVMFIAGISQNSGQFLQALYGSFNPAYVVGFAVSWAWTNVMFLACFASLAGELGRVAAGNQRANLISAAARGFLIYLAFVAGQLVLNGTLPMDPNSLDATVLSVKEPQYFRVAACVSLLAFMAGFNPVFFSTLVARLEGFATQSQPPELIKGSTE